MRRRWSSSPTDASAVRCARIFSRRSPRSRRRSASTRVLVESSGISEPLPVAETFTFKDDNSASLSDVASLHNLVTVVDSPSVFEQLGSMDKLVDRGWQAGEEDTRGVSSLLCEQLEFADVLIVNKTDLLSEEQLSAVECLLKKVNPGAEVLRTSHSKVEPSLLLDKARFSLRQAEAHPQWLKEAREHEHTPETVEYGISSFIYKAARPFHPERLHAALGSKPRPESLTDAQFALHAALGNQTRPESLKGLLRLKGFAWLATRNQMQVNLALAGTQFRVSPGTPWWAFLGKERWPSEGLDESIKEIWDETHGDRRTSLVCIGQELDHKAASATLDTCLLTEEEMGLGEEGWLALPDPLTGVQVQAEAVVASEAAIAYEAAGRLSEAAEEYERLLKIKETVYGPEQPNHPELAVQSAAWRMCISSKVC